MVQYTIQNSTLMDHIDYSADTYSDDQQDEDYSNEDGEAPRNNEDYYSSEEDGEAAKKTNHKGDGEATANSEDYHNSENDGEASKKADDSRGQGASNDTKKASEDDKEREEETYDSNTWLRVATQKMLQKVTREYYEEKQRASRLLMGSCVIKERKES